MYLGWCYVRNQARSDEIPRYLSRGSLAVQWEITYNPGHSHYTFGPEVWTISNHTCHTGFITTRHRVDWLTSLASKLKYIALYCRAIYFATVDTDTCTVSTLLTALETFANFLFKVDFITLLSSEHKTFWLTCNLLACLQIRKGTKIKSLNHFNKQNNKSFLGWASSSSSMSIFIFIEQKILKTTHSDILAWFWCLI